MKAGLLVLQVLAGLRIESVGSQSLSRAELTIMGQLRVTQGEPFFRLPCPHQSEREGGPEGASKSVVWLLHEQNLLVGPGVKYNVSKYRYVPATGELTIQNIDFDDAGIYRCIIKYEGKEDGSTRHETSAVLLIVGQQYQNLWEEEYKKNLTRALIAATISGCLLSLCCGVYKFRWKEPSYMRYVSTDMLDLESPALELEAHSAEGGGGAKASENYGGGSTDPPAPGNSSRPLTITHI